MAAAAIGAGDAGNLVTASPAYAELERPELFAAFGTSLIFVMFCFAGWNAAAYVAGRDGESRSAICRARS